MLSGRRCWISMASVAWPCTLDIMTHTSYLQGEATQRSPCLLPLPAQPILHITYPPTSWRNVPISHNSTVFLSTDRQLTIRH
ncbi:hypothetical protein EDC04DRAFT_2637257 [Pisolithus marmoratus]|nr:hypothetical protein EDC04DRAFT_2637257 [Pisolithus marmoratus]